MPSGPGSASLVLVESVLDELELWLVLLAAPDEHCQGSEFGGQGLLPVATRAAEPPNVPATGLVVESQALKTKTAVAQRHRPDLRCILLGSTRNGGLLLAVESFAPGPSAKRDRRVERMDWQPVENFR